MDGANIPVTINTIKPRIPISEDTAIALLNKALEATGRNQAVILLALGVIDSAEGSDEEGEGLDGEGEANLTGLVKGKLTGSGMRWRKGYYKFEKKA